MECIRSLLFRFIFVLYVCSTLVASAQGACTFFWGPANRQWDFSALTKSSTTYTDWYFYPDGTGYAFWFNLCAGDSNNPPFQSWYAQYDRRTGTTGVASGNAYLAGGTFAYQQDGSVTATYKDGSYQYRIYLVCDASVTGAPQISPVTPAITGVDQVQLRSAYACGTEVCAGCNTTHATCSQAGVCTCSAGWTGAGCNTPICNSPTCGSHSTCVAPNTCTCDAGWTGATPDSCTNAICTTSCGDHSSCVSPNTCQCNAGWTGSNSSSCTTPICDTPCTGHSTCTAPNTCTCNAGWTGASCTNPICTTSCGSHATCTAPNTCSCESGWTGTNGLSCPNAICTTTCGAHSSCTAPNTCTCNAGWTGNTGSDCPNPVCSSPCGANSVCTAPDTCTCAAGWTGTTSASCTNAICTTPCGAHATCTAPNTCTCNAGWTGTDGISCPNAICSTACGTNSACTAPNSCTCNAGWTGSSGSSCTNPVCSSPSCGAHSSCTAPNTCTCAAGWTGTTSASCTNPICTTPCGAHATCTGPNTCTCNAGWTGTDGISCPTPICATACGANSVCTAPNTCTCTAGWTGSTGNSCPNPVCSSCPTHSTCTGPNTCTCNAGWTGTNCASAICSPACGNKQTCSAPNVCSSVSAADCTFFWAATNQKWDFSSLTKSTTNYQNWYHFFDNSQYAFYFNLCGGDGGSPAYQSYYAAAFVDRRGIVTEGQSHPNAQLDGAVFSYLQNGHVQVSYYDGPGYTFSVELVCNTSVTGAPVLTPDNVASVPGTLDRVFFSSAAACSTPACPGCNFEHGSCTAVNTCTCSDTSQWSGTTCSTPVCAPSCGSHSTCTAPNTCTCDAGWTGDTGSNCPNPVCSTACGTNSACTAPNTCTCTTGWTGSSGSNCPEPVCTPACGTNSACTAPNTCTCNAGWNGTISSSCPNPVCTNTCDNRGTCDSPNVCTCNPGWSGDTSGCNTYVCTGASACGARGTCVGPNVCSCNDGFDGAFTGCNKCNAGYGSYPECAPTCDTCTYEGITSPTGWSTFRSFVEMVAPGSSKPLVQPTYRRQDQRTRTVMQPTGGILCGIYTSYDVTYKGVWLAGNSPAKSGVTGEIGSLSYCLTTLVEKSSNGDVINTISLDSNHTTWTLRVNPTSNAARWIGYLPNSQGTLIAFQDPTNPPLGSLGFGLTVTITYNKLASATNSLELRTVAAAGAGDVKNTGVNAVYKTAVLVPAYDSKFVFPTTVSTTVGAAQITTERPADWGSNNIDETMALFHVQNNVNIRYWNSAPAEMFKPSRVNIAFPQGQEQFTVDNFILTPTDINV